MRIIRNLRWYMIGMVMLATVLNYLARNSLAVAAPTIMEEMHFTVQQYSYIDAIFKGCYTLTQPVAGYILDLLGTKVGYLPFAIAWAIMVHSWNFAFLLTGGVSLIWAVGWYKLYHTPDKHKNISTQERDYIYAGQESRHHSSNKQKVPVSQLLKDSQFWGIAIPRFLAEPAWGTINAWVPLFLYKVYGFDLKHIAMFAWMPLLFADLGCILGGYMPGFFQKHFGVTLIVSRKLVVTVGALCMIGPGLIGLYHSPYFAIAMLCFGGFAHQTLSGALITLSSDLFGRNEVATANGLTGMIGWGGSTLFTLVVGALVGIIGFSPLFLMLSIFEITAMIIVWTAVKGRPDKTTPQPSTLA